MSVKKDDWEKPRSRGQHLTEDEIAIIRQRKRQGHEPRDIARALKCSTRVVYNHFQAIDGRVDNPRRGRPPRLHTKPAEQPPPKQTEAERRAARFYRSNFEL